MIDRSVAGDSRAHADRSTCRPAQAGGALSGRALADVIGGRCGPFAGGPRRAAAGWRIDDAARSGTQDAARWRMVSMPRLCRISAQGKSEPDASSIRHKGSTPRKFAERNLRRRRFACFAANSLPLRRYPAPDQLLAPFLDRAQQLLKRIGKLLDAVGFQLFGDLHPARCRLQPGRPGRRAPARCPGQPCAPACHGRRNACSVCGGMVLTVCGPISVST